MAQMRRHRPFAGRWSNRGSQREAAARFGRNWRRVMHPLSPKVMV